MERVARACSADINCGDSCIGEWLTVMVRYDFDPLGRMKIDFYGLREEGIIRRPFCENLKGAHLCRHRKFVSIFYISECFCLTSASADSTFILFSIIVNER